MIAIAINYSHRTLACISISRPVIRQASRHRSAADHRGRRRAAHGPDEFLVQTALLFAGLSTIVQAAPSDRSAPDFRSSPVTQPRPIGVTQFRVEASLWRVARGLHVSFANRCARTDCARRSDCEIHVTEYSLGFNQSCTTFDRNRRFDRMVLEPARSVSDGATVIFHIDRHTRSAFRRQIWMVHQRLTGDPDRRAGESLEIDSGDETVCGGTASDGAI